MNLRINLRGGKINSSTKLVFIFWLLFFNFNCFGNTWVEKKVKLNNFPLQFKAPKSWQYVEGLYGRDITLLGPEGAKKRDVITLEHAKSKSFSLKKESKAIPKYKKIKLAWIKQKEATLLQFNLGKALPQVQNSHLYNEVSYSLNGIKYVEGDLFLQCSQKSFLNLSFLTLKENDKKFKEVWINFLKSIKC